jgi:hypothetical protein
MAQRSARPSSLARVLVVVALVGLGMATSAADAFARCTPGRSGDANVRFDGTGGNVTGIQGIKASIEENNPSVSTNSGVFAWVMLQTPTKIAQIGWQQDDTNNIESRTVFTYFTTGTGVNVWLNFPPKPIPHMTLYQQLYDPVAKQFTASADGAIYYQTTDTWVPNHFSVDGETHSKADQMPDLISNHEKFLGTWEKHGGSWWTLTTAAGATDTSIHGAVRVNGTDYETWDLGCP